MNQHYQNFKSMIEGEARPNGPTIGQIRELRKLVSEREFPAGHPMRGAEPKMRDQGMLERLRSVNPDRETVEGWLSYLRSLPVAETQQEIPTPAPKPKPGPAEEGMYMLNGEIYKVQIAVHGSGRPYAKKLTCFGEDSVYDPKTGGQKLVGDWRFTYAPGIVWQLGPEHKLTKEQAKEFGALYGTCCRCARTLTNEDSIERMMGPVCYSKMGW